LCDSHKNNKIQVSFIGSNLVCYFVSPSNIHITGRFGIWTH